MTNHPALLLLPPLSSCDNPDGRDLFKNMSFFFSARHPMYDRVRLIVTSHGGLMVALRDLALIRLVDPGDEFIPAGSLSLEYLRESIMSNHVVDSDGFIIGAPGDGPESGMLNFPRADSSSESENEAPLVVEEQPASESIRPPDAVNSPVEEERIAPASSRDVRVARSRSPRGGGRPRRPRMTWSAEEVACLQVAFSVLGSSWESMRRQYPLLSRFTGEQLKDKYRASFGSRAGQ